MVTGFDRSKSLQELENTDWGEPTYHSSLVITCHRLRRKPLNEFTVANLRIMIGQSISLSYLIPLAIEILEVNPLVEGYFYPGGLLSAVLRVDESFWTSHPAFYQRMGIVVRRVKNLLPTLDEVDRPTAEQVLKDTSPAFRLNDPE